jgi:hypothetical protein
MTDNQIIKALEFCANHDNGSCFGCPLLKNKDCFQTLSRASLDLINRQQAEIERYKETYGCYPVWNVPCENVFVLSMSCDDYEDFKNQLKAEAIKEFAERLKEKAKNNEWNGTICGVDIDNLVKEMVGEE